MAALLRTSVVTAAGAAALISLADIKDDLGVTDTSTDAFLTRAIARVSGLVTTYSGQTFAADQVTDTFELPDEGLYEDLAPDITTLQLAEWPVAAIGTVTENGATLDPSLYALDPSSGLLTRQQPDGEPGYWGTPVVVSYTAGGAPAQVADAVSRLVALRYFARGRDPALRSEALPGVGSSSWAGGGTSAGIGRSGLPLDVEALLDDLCVPVVA